jgi:hypothetical protein
MDVPPTEEEIRGVYTWVDKHPLSRPKRNISRDFADGVCVAEILKFYFPKVVELHNFVPANNLKQKVDNWLTLNAKVLRKLHFEVSAADITDIANAVPGAIERFLMALQVKIVQIQQRQGASGGDEDRLTGAPSRSGVSSPSQQQGGVGASRRPATAAVAGTASSRLVSRAPAAVTSAAPPPAVAESEKDRMILDLHESVQLLTSKIKQLEELVRLKDAKIADLQARMH